MILVGPRSDMLVHSLRPAGQCSTQRTDVYAVRPKTYQLMRGLIHRSSLRFRPRASLGQQNGDDEQLTSRPAKSQQFKSQQESNSGSNGSTSASAGATSSSDDLSSSSAPMSQRLRRPRQHQLDNLFESGALSRQGESIWPRGNLTAVILGGGETDSRRLFPLTQFRTLPAIPFGGTYRIIDLLMSNLINSGVNKIHILTAYNSYSLNRHLQRTYDMSSGVPYGGDGYVEVVANSMSPDSQQWVTGTAGIVRHFMSYFDTNTKNRFIEDILILPGDHVYSTDLTPIIEYHHSTGADLTVVCRPVSGELAKRLGVVKLDADNRIRTFREKPSSEQLQELAMSDDELRSFLTTTSPQQQQQQQQYDGYRNAAHQHSSSKRVYISGTGLGGHSAPGSSISAAASSDDGEGLAAARALWAARGHARADGGAGGRVVLDTLTSSDDTELSQRPGGGDSGYVGSTGIYIFRREVLSNALARYYKAHDFGRQIIPDLIRDGLRVYAYRLPGYWADVGGAVGDFYDANMALLDNPPSINFNMPLETPIFKFPFTIPASQMKGSKIQRAMVSAGCIIQDAAIHNSVIGPRSIIGSRVTVTDSVIMGADHYQHEKPQLRTTSPTYPPIGIGEDSVVHKAIVDLNCRIGRNVALVNKEGVYESFDRAIQGMYIRNGVIVLARDSVVPDGTVL